MPLRKMLLGGPVDVVRSDEVMRFIADAVAAGRKATIANQNLHSLYLSRKSEELRAFFANADLIEIDSMPLLHWGRLLGLNLSRGHRSTYLDWRDQFWSLAAAGRWRVFLLGATEEVNDQATARLSHEWPEVTIAGHHGYFEWSAGGCENNALLDSINAFRPDILLVGMGMPLQETWIHDNAAALVSGVALSVGAAIDYESGVQNAAPRIYGDLCLEWLYRLAHDPRRLYGRYLIEPWALLGAAVSDVMHHYILSRAASRRPLSVTRWPSAREVEPPRDIASSDDLPRAA